MKINNAARQLIRSSSRGYLSTQFNPKTFKSKKISTDNSFPYSTFTMTAFDYDLSPIVLLSDLSEHTTNVKHQNLVSLMLCEERRLYSFFPQFENDTFDYEDPMSRPRITLIGNLKKTENDNHKRRFLLRHPASKLYSGFSDMNFFKLDVIGAHLVGGFASVKWFSREDLIFKDAINYENYESSVISHMNESHQESIDLYISKLIKIPKSEPKKNWKLIGIDPEGFDLRFKDKIARYFFEKEIADAKKLRGLFVGLHKKATKA